MQAIIRSTIDRGTGEVVSEKTIKPVEIDDYYQPLVKMFYARIKKELPQRAAKTS